MKNIKELNNLSNYCTKLSQEIGFRTNLVWNDDEVVVEEGEFVSTVGICLVYERIINIYGMYRRNKDEILMAFYHELAHAYTIGDSQVLYRGRSTEKDGTNKLAVEVVATEIQKLCCKNILKQENDKLGNYYVEFFSKYQYDRCKRNHKKLIINTYKRIKRAHDKLKL